MVLLLACFPVFRITSSCPTSQRSKPVEEWVKSHNSWKDPMFWTSITFVTHTEQTLNSAMPWNDISLPARYILLVCFYYYLAHLHRSTMELGCGHLYVHKAHQSKLVDRQNTPLSILTANYMEWSGNDGLNAPQGRAAHACSIRSLILFFVSQEWPWKTETMEFTKWGLGSRRHKCVREMMPGFYEQFKQSSWTSLSAVASFLQCPSPKPLQAQVRIKPS